MTDFHLMTVSVPYRATGVPKGGRIARPHVFRASVAVAIEIVRDPATAVLCSDEFGRETAYLGHARSLWRPITEGRHKGGAVVSAELALSRMKDGLGLDRLDDVENPFLHLGDRKILPGFFAGKGAIEDAELRSIEWTDRDATVAAAQRLAGDLLLTEDGRLLRRSPGPFWGQYTSEALHLIPSEFTLPAGPEVFACTRLEEAKEFLASEHPGRWIPQRGRAIVLDPECVPDHDAHIAARSLCRRECASWLELVMPLATHDVAVLAQAAITGYERLHGLGIEVLTSKDGRNLPTPASAIAPTPVQIAEAVDAMRDFVEAMPGPISDEKVEDVCRNWRSVFADLAGRAIRRYDAFERHRLPDPRGVPDIGAVPSFAL